MPENGEMVELVFAMENACLQEEAENHERLVRPAGANYWLVEVVPIGPLPAMEWVARYEWMDDDLTEMML